MTKPSLRDLLKQHFPTAEFNESTSNLMVGSFHEWDSLAHFNFLIFVEEAYGIRFDVEEMSELKSLDDIGRSLERKNLPQ